MALEFFGPSRVVWGSDFPAQRNPVESIKALNNLGIPRETKEHILGQNLINLFNEKGE
jgi:predicted TIM-barrel fold metal-dependent hydrolase